MIWNNRTDHFMHAMSPQWLRWRWSACWEKFSSGLLYSSCWSYQVCVSYCCAKEGVGPDCAKSTEAFGSQWAEHHLSQESFHVLNIFSRRRFDWHYGSHWFYRWDGDPWDWKAEAERGAVRAPPNPSRPQGASGRLLLQLVRWDPALKNDPTLTSMAQTTKQQSKAKANRFYLLKKRRHTFLRAVNVCAVGLRLSELQGDTRNNKVKMKEISALAHPQAMMSHKDSAWNLSAR